MPVSRYMYVCTLYILYSDDVQYLFSIRHSDSNSNSKQSLRSKCHGAASRAVLEKFLLSLKWPHVAVNELNAKKIELELMKIVS